MQRAIVGLRQKSGNYKIPKFSECLLECFGKNAGSVNVNFSVENGILILNESEEGWELSHSPICPIKLLSKSDLQELDVNEDANNSLKKPTIGLAASVVVESSDSHVLLTKRAAHMRSSPNVWVTPGGHLDYGETIYEAGVREVKEETGLDISKGKISILGFWENVYPLTLGVGTPKNHVLVVYLYTYLNEPHYQLTKKIVPNSEEVDSYAWISLSTVTKLFNFSFETICDGKQYIIENNEIVEKHLDQTKMFNMQVWKQPKSISGINYALRSWMNKINKEKQSCKI